MQFNPVYLYSNKVDVFTSSMDTWSTERYRKVYNRNLKIFRGVDNRIDIQVRNADQKATNLTPPNDPTDNLPYDNILVFNLVSRDTKDLVLQKDFTAMDLATGKVTVTLTETELVDLDNGFYSYSIIKELRKNLNEDSTVLGYKVISKMPMYMDAQYDTVGTLEITGDVYGDVEPSVLVDTFNYTNPFTQGDETPKFFVSQIIDARPTLNTANSTHTFQFYTSDNYQGTVTIEGSLDTQGATPRESKWVTIGDPVNLTATKYRNVVGKYNWFRIKHVPTTANTGTVDKILYR